MNSISPEDQSAEQDQVRREHAEGLVTYLYRFYLSREPDKEGFEVYVNEYLGGMPEERLVEIFSTSDEARANPHVFDDARALEGEARFVEALAEYDRLIAAGDEVSIALTRRGLLNAQLGRFSQMTADLERGQAADAGDPYPWMWQGQYAKQMRRPHFAASCFEGAVSAAPARYLGEMRLNLAEAYLRLGWLDRAASLGRLIPAESGWWAASRRAAIEGVPRCRAATFARLRKRRAAPLDNTDSFALAQDLAALGRLDVADRLCLALMREAPHDFAPFELRGRIIARRDGLVAALSFLEGLEWLHRDTPEWVLATARILHDLGRYAQAIALGERSGKAHEDGELLAVIGFACVGLDDPARLVGFCRRWMFASDDAVPAAGLLVTAFAARTRDAPVAGPPAAPQRLGIIRFWNDPQIPGDVARVIGSWSRHNPNLDSIVFNTQTAAAFIAEHHGSDAAEAFALCHHPAMQADVFRIAFLAAKGGLYADADEECTRPMPTLLARAAVAEIAAVQSGEIPDFLHNYFLGSHDDSPTLRRALALQIRDLRSYAHEQRPINIWHNTGPGLLTRAVGLALAERFDIATPDEMMLIPLQQYRAFVRVAEELSYKQNAADSWHLS